MLPMPLRYLLMGNPKSDFVLSIDKGLYDVISHKGRISDVPRTKKSGNESSISTSLVTDDGLIEHESGNPPLSYHSINIKIAARIKYSRIAATDD
jgi:hypothetical protein